MIPPIIPDDGTETDGGDGDTDADGGPGEDDEDDEDDEGDEDDDEQDQEDDDDANTMVSASPIMNKKEPLDDVIEELELAAIKEEDAPVIAVEEVSPRSPLKCPS